MDEILQYEKFVCDRITELREKRGISEHRLSLELGKSGSYIRSITSGCNHALCKGAVQYHPLF